MWPQLAGSVRPAHSAGGACSSPCCKRAKQPWPLGMALGSSGHCGGQLRSLWPPCNTGSKPQGSRDRRHRQHPARACAGPWLDERKDKRMHKGKSCTRRVKTLLCVAGLKTGRKTKRSEICWLQHFLCYMCNIFVMNVITKSVHSILF